MPITRSTWTDSVTVINNAQLQTIYTNIDANPATVAWTPAFNGSGHSYGGSTVGYYTVLAKQVTFMGQVTLISLGAIAGAVEITGLPTAGALGNAAITVGYWAGTTTNFLWLGGYLSSGSTIIVLTGVTVAAGGISFLAQADLSNSTNLVVGGTYITV